MSGVEPEQVNRLVGILSGIVGLSEMNALGPTELDELSHLGSELHAVAGGLEDACQGIHFNIPRIR